MSPTATETSTFISNDPYYRAIRKPEREVFQDGFKVKVPGEAAIFNNGLFQTDDPEMIEWLREHEDKDMKFYEKGQEPDRLRPFSEDVIAAITTAAIEGDAETVRALQTSERSTHSRADVLAAADTALEHLDPDGDTDTTGLSPEPEKEPEEEPEPVEEPAEPEPEEPSEVEPEPVEGEPEGAEVESKE